MTDSCSWSKPTPACHWIDALSLHGCAWEAHNAIVRAATLQPGGEAHTAEAQSDNRKGRICDDMIKIVD